MVAVHRAAPANSIAKGHIILSIHTGSKRWLIGLGATLLLGHKRYYLVSRSFTRVVLRMGNRDLQSGRKLTPTLRFSMKPMRLPNAP